MKVDVHGLFEVERREEGDIKGIIIIKIFEKNMICGTKMLEHNGAKNSKDKMRKTH